MRQGICHLRSQSIYPEDLQFIPTYGTVKESHANQISSKPPTPPEEVAPKQMSLVSSAMTEEHQSKSNSTNPLSAMSSNSSESAAKASGNPCGTSHSIPNITSSSSTTNENAIILSLYLIQSEEDILHKTNSNVHKRANLYKRLSEACQIANKTLCSASSCTTQPFQAGGDGAIFGVHCNVSNDELLSFRNEFDADDLWQSQGTDEQCRNEDEDDDHEEAERQNEIDTIQQPHLRAIFRYGNDINDMWRCISLMLQITADLANADYLSCIECWDITDGHILLIEAAEHLPSWVDDDVIQGGVGGPEGTHNRCWIVDGKVHLIPPTTRNKKRDTLSVKNEKVDLLSRREALNALVDSFQIDPDGSSTLASYSVQDAIYHRINRTDYSARNISGESRVSASSNSHWHVSAAALPASVAYFIQKHPLLVPLIIDSFCENAPKYLKQWKRKRKNNTSDETNEGATATDTQAPSMEQTCNNQEDTFGNLFPFEQIIAVPITMTRANFAELVTGRGIVPAFPVPREYRSVELKRFHRQLGQTAFGELDNDDKSRNPFERAVDVGVRLCAGLEWIIACSEQNVKADTDCNDDEDLQLDSLGDVERRLRLFWTRVDAEASGDILQPDSEDNDTDHWIEKAWQAGPTNSNGIQCDRMLLCALESMSKCPVFNPELSKSSRDEPCPITMPNISLREMTQSGMKNALKWQRDEYDESHFPMPKLYQLDSDAWMEIKSMEALEEKMKDLSTATTKTDVPSKSERGPRRTTRRSRRNLNANSSDKKGYESTNRDTLNTMASGFRAFVEGEGDVEGISATTPETERTPTNDSIESLMSQEVNIKPRAFFGALESMLRDQQNPSSLSGTETKSEASPAEPVEPDISSFFFEEDLNYESGDDSDVDVDAQMNMMQTNQISPDDDPFSLKNIMQAMDHELRTDAVSDPSIKNLSVAMEDDLDDEAMANLLRSIEASEGAGPARNMLLGMGIPLPRPTTTTD